MLVKVLGVIDLIAGSILIFGSNAGINGVFGVLGGVLIAKSFIGFLKDMGSWIDIITGVVLLANIILPIPAVINIIIGLLIIQKGIISFL